MRVTENAEVRVRKFILFLQSFCDSVCNSVWNHYAPGQFGCTLLFEENFKFIRGIKKPQPFGRGYTLSGFHLQGKCSK
ncbi:hypothetical protein AVV66_gp144 [Escherichia phage vB_EcoM_VR26]|uniref:Uncharacterized protein n=1 Tax=Escherichia phage vB_EcoM_VR26 TaxID=1567029 RepID=A0A0A7HEK1_9CAUD|nr:hypothetical protein AVV66_gp144 [Escherichia phage vB_EcoM_VR26]AIZ02781.1 hypothetical protein VR26_144 [Escherichia phage vB_EcoM_VR26]